MLDLTKVFRHTRAAIVVLILTASVPAFAVDPVFSPPPPVVQILLDTSGSMQYTSAGHNSETTDANTNTLPTCSTTIGASGRSRYIVATEILAGTLTNYTCTRLARNNASAAGCPSADCNYAVPHVQANGTRLTDGLIDKAGSKMKFGIMTMDNKTSVATTQGGAFSYGPETGTNLGAQNSTSTIGAMVKPSASDSPASILAANAAVKASLLAARPFNPTPLGPLFWDAEYMYNNDPVFTADPYKNCRDKHIILITDGRNNQGSGIGTYLDPVVAANRLRTLGFEVWVIAFKMGTNITSSARDIATYNGTLSDDHYFLALDAAGLSNALYQVISNIAVISQSRTRTVYTEDTGNPLDVQYQFNAAYANALDLVGGELPGVKQGILERSLYKCGVDVSSPSAATLAQIQSFGEKLNATADGSRNIYTMIAGVLEAFTNTNADITNAILAAPDPATTTVPDFGRNSTTGWCKSGTLTGTSAQKLAAWRANLFQYIRADDASCRDGYKLGAIYHSTPAIQEKFTELTYAIPSFAGYRASIATRPVMLYSATHDGMMHAFRLDRPDGTLTPDDWGKELWAYIPGHLLGTLKELPDGRETVLDGTPVIADIVMSRTATSQTSEDATDWKSVLLFGDRSGGRGFTALDVTNPVDGYWSVLWEVSGPSGRCTGGSSSCNAGGAAAYKNDFTRLGYTYGRPVIGTVMICPSDSGLCAQSQLEEVAVAVFGGGSSTGIGTVGAGKTAFVVRLDTGEKIAEFATGDIDGDNATVKSNCTNTANVIDSDIIGDVSCMSTMPGTFLTRCFVGDRAGRLWKIEIGSPARSNWQMRLFYDPYDFTAGTTDVNSVIRAPAYEAPAISLTKATNEPVIVYSGGDMDNLLETAQKSFIVSLTETMVGTEPADCMPWDDNVCFRSAGTGMLIGPKVNWKMFASYDSNLALMTGELAGARVMGAPLIYGGVTYFTTFTPSSTNVCIPGRGRLYGVDYVLRGASCDLLKARLPSVSNPLVFETYQQIGSATTGSVPYGVVVINRPACIDGESIGVAGYGGASGNPFGDVGAAGPKIVVQTGVNTGETVEEPANNATDRSIQQILRNAGRIIESIIVGTWGSVFD
jgi:hypothetical protein